MPARNEAAEAEENLRVIRSLMEKATVYRALSAPGALLGGALSVATAAVGAFLSGEPKYTSDAFFLFLWLIVLGITAIANGFLLWLDAKKRGDAFISPGMKLVLSAMFPGMAAGGLCFLFDGWLVDTASLWVLCYGISLLAASPFAPGSIRRLGWLFFGAGTALLVLIHRFFGVPGRLYPDIVPHLIMGCTFGLFHLGYAACTWRHRTRGETHGA